MVEVAAVNCAPIKKIDAILPLKCQVDGRDSDLTRALLGLLPSMCLNGYDTIIRELRVIAPEPDIAAIKGELQRVAGPISVSLSHEQSYFSELGFSDTRLASVPGWFRQQFLKLAAVAASDADLCLVLDADVICLRKFDPTMLALGPWPYQQVGLTSFPGWFRMAAAALALNENDLEQGRFGRPMGVTPEFLASSITRDLLVRLKTLAGSNDWGPYLMTFFKNYVETWTEYSLYWSWYSQRGVYGDIYNPTHLYRFIEDSAVPDLTTLLTDGAYFAVLQSTKVSLRDCASLHGEIQSALSKNGSG